MIATYVRAIGVCLLAVVAVATVGAAISGYTISGSDAIETPTQTVSYQGQEYTISGVSRITEDGSVTVTTTVPSGTGYYINLRGPENQLISSDRVQGNASHTFSYFGSGEAGTYAATIQDGGNTVAVHPIVIAGYAITVSSPGEVTTGEEVTIRAAVTERSVQKHSSLDSVEVVVGNDDIESQQSMTKVDDDTYETTVSTDGLAANTYSVYVLVRGNKTVRQRAEILGVSNTVELTVTDGTTTEPTNDGDETGGGGGISDDSEPNSGFTTSTEQTPTPTPETGETATAAGETETVQPGVSTTSKGNNPEATASERTTSDDAENVIAPSTPGSPSTTSGSGPGFTIGVAMLAVLATIAVGRHR